MTDRHTVTGECCTLDCVNQGSTQTMPLLFCLEIDLWTGHGNTQWVFKPVSLSKLGKLEIIRWHSIVAIVITVIFPGNGAS